MRRRLKFLFSDSLDFVDPEYDFRGDRHGAGRRAHEDDEFPHEHLGVAPYDGILISRAIVGDARRGGKYSEAQCLRFSREGARQFLRYPASRYPGSIVMGDCGAFSYHRAAVPPYQPQETLEFYLDSGFTHGCSVDHVIFDFEDDRTKPSPEARQRYEITLENARVFLRAAKRTAPKFVPVGVVQGWSAKSMGAAARELVRMGYRYIALGGMVPLKTPQIARALAAIREQVPSETELHLLGFGKTEDLGVLRAHRVSSFDTTSPLRRAFKDAKKNYYALGPDSELRYYTAIRIPQAIDNDKLLRRAKRGKLNQERLLAMEAEALHAVRSFGERRCAAADAAASVIAYGRYALWDDAVTEERNERRLGEFAKAYERTLSDRAWESCSCRVCREAGVETLIFRSSNRNKRRGIHNLHVFYASLHAR
ncbi:MAG TPA: tRNA-guanine transglycosylase DpdA [Candidatus Elarobacter sp.]|nr:tRNA-guanine transglycosylase DpdA [Candidatus Elarobacter sp.]